MGDKVDLIVFDIDDYPMMLRMELLDKAQTFVIPSLNSICIMGGNNAYTESVTLEPKRKMRHAIKI